MCTVLSVYLRHTNGCIPTPLQYSIAKQRIGDGLFKVPKPLAVTLHILFRSRGFHNSTVRELLREHGVVQRDEVVTGMMIANLRMKLGTLDADHTKWKEDNLTVSREFNINFGCSHEDGMDSAACKIQIEKFASEYVKSHLNEDGASVVNLLATIKEEYVGFEFRIARNSSKELTGWMFMTAEMQYMAAKYAQVVFLDAVKSKVSAVDWPFYPVAVVDEENKLYVIAFCLCVQESNDAYTWILKSIKSIVPSFQHIVKVTMSDRLVSDHVMHDALCLHLAGMCNWHLRERNLAEWVSKHPFKKEILKDFKLKLQEPDITISEWNENVEQFKEKWKGAASAFVDSILPEKHRWTAPYTRKFFLCFKSGNSMAESANASVIAFLTGEQNHAELVSFLLQYNHEKNTEQRTRHQRVSGMLEVELQLLGNPDVRMCKAANSDFITGKFQAELELSKSYRGKCVTNETGNYAVLQVWHHQYPQKHRIVTQETSLSMLKCSCLTASSQGMPCRHILICLLILGEDLYQAKYFHPRWERRTDLPCDMPAHLLFFPETCSECKQLPTETKSAEFDFEGEECLGFDGSDGNEFECAPDTPHRRQGATKLTAQQKTYRQLKTCL